jgi:hypothetical protein
MTDVSIAGAVLAGLVSFLSPCVLPLVPGYVSMLSGIGMEQLRQEEPPRAGLFATSLALRRRLLVRIYLVRRFGERRRTISSRESSAPGTGGRSADSNVSSAPHWLVGKLSPRVGVVLGVLLVSLGFVSALEGGALFAGFRAVHFSRSR